MNDFIAQFVSSAHVRDWTVICNFVSAIFIGPYLAFAATPDAGFKCLQAFVRLVHRVLLVMFSIALMYNALVIIGDQNRIPTGGALAINVMIVLTVLCSAVRYHFWMGDVPKDASWRHPNLVSRSR